MTNLQVILHESFNSHPVDVYRDENGEERMTRQQIADMLGISINAIDQMHRRYQKRLSRFSVPDKLSGTDGKLYKTYLYNFKGVLEIARRSNSPLADAVMDFVWELADKLRRGELSPTSDYLVKRLEAVEAELFIEKKLNSQYEDSDDTIEFDYAADMISQWKKPPFTRKHFIQWLASHEIVTVQPYKNDQPRKEYINNGWFVAKPHRWMKGKQWRFRKEYLITIRGMNALIRLAIRERYLQLPESDQMLFPFLLNSGLPKIGGVK